tara:strand:- start:719 stop:1006 length:288 start_codon:yes stop_codon:yes gene_type:complete
MSDYSNPVYGHGVMLVTLCRILKPQEEWEGQSSGPISSMQVAVPSEVMEEVAAAGDLELLDLWVEDEFGFPWLLNHAGQMSFMPVKDYKEWCNEI